MSILYHAFLSEVVITTDNNAIKFTVLGAPYTASIPIGTYYLRSNGASDDLCEAIAAAMELADPGTNNYLVSHSHRIAATGPAGVVSFDLSSGTEAYALLFADGDTTFDPAVLGFAASDTASSTSAKVSTLTPSCTWMADQACSLDVESEDGEAAQERMQGGQVYTLDLGGPYGLRRLAWQLVDPDRTLASSITSDSNRAFSSFWGRVRDGRSMEVWAAPEDSSANYVYISAGTDLGTYVLDDQSINTFAPTRYDAGLELYSWEIGLREYVA